MRKRRIVGFVLWFFGFLFIYGIAVSASQNLWLPSLLMAVMFAGLYLLDFLKGI